MDYFGDNSLAKLIALVKDELTDQEDSIKNEVAPYVISGGFSLTDDGDPVIDNVYATRLKVETALGEERQIELELYITDTGELWDLPLDRWSRSDDTLQLRFTGHGNNQQTGAIYHLVVNITFVQSQMLVSYSSSEEPIVGDTLPSAAGTASAGISANAARADHVHPSEIFTIEGTLETVADELTVTGITVTKAELNAAIAAGKVLMARLTYSDANSSYSYELPLFYGSDGTYTFNLIQGNTSIQLYISYDGDELVNHLLTVDELAIRGEVEDIPIVSTYAATIGTTWTEDENTGVKTQSVAIDGVLSTHTAHVDHVYTGSGTSEDYVAFVEAENEYLNCITNGFAETYDGGVKFTIFGDAPTVSIPIVVEVA